MRKVNDYIKNNRRIFQKISCIPEMKNVMRRRFHFRPQKNGAQLLNSVSIYL